MAMGEEYICLLFLFFFFSCFLTCGEMEITINYGGRVKVKPYKVGKEKEKENCSAEEERKGKNLFTHSRENPLVQLLTCTPSLAVDSINFSFFPKLPLLFFLISILPNFIIIMVHCYKYCLPSLSLFLYGSKYSCSTAAASF